MRENRTRKNRVVFYLNDEELQSMQEKMSRLGIRNREAFVRKLTKDGYIINIDVKPTEELVRLVRNVTTNINQMAHRANESGSVYENDVLELLAEVNNLNPLIVEAHQWAVKMLKR